MHDDAFTKTVNKFTALNYLRWCPGNAVLQRKDTCHLHYENSKSFLQYYVKQPFPTDMQIFSYKY
jgi:hypothetical protein